MYHHFITRYNQGPYRNNERKQLTASIEEDTKLANPKGSISKGKQRSWVKFFWEEYKTNKEQKRRFHEMSFAKALKKFDFFASLYNTY